ncbi:uncharacterized protein LOC133192944 [Saccostrea echinata]|uniref:uncharacterized protein LOC133192944 n=1 Tax=Saccostrea echinata TaxID=191078 RepID=UPI002A7FDB3C|nr:uncharacterized protein LOC133192944 [Saccostrea echinata]
MASYRYRYRSRRLFDDSDSSSSETSDSESVDDEESSEDSEEDLRGATYLPKHRPRGSGFKAKSGYQIGNATVTVVGGEITRQKVDVIVNGTNPRLDLSQGRASSSLLAAAGRGIQRECRQNYPERLDPGEIAVTTGGNLACKAIYHGVLTKYSSKKDERILADLVTECLDQADADGYRSIAFPPIGTGNLSYNPARVAEIMLECIEDCTSRTVTSVSIVIYSQESSCFQDFLNAAMRYSSSTSKLSLSSNKKRGSKASPGISISNFSNNIGGINVNVSVGSLQDQNVDVVVNSIGQDLSMDSALSSALVSAAGPNLMQELHQTCLGKIPFGFVAVTKGYNLNCKEVFHGALSSWSSKTTGSKHQPDIVLEEFVYKCLKTANSRGHKSIAFPALGTGQLKFPPDVAAACTVAGIKKFSAKYSISEIRILLYSGSPDLNQLKKAFKDEMTTPGHRVSKAGKSASVEHFSQYSEPKRGTEAWLAWKYREDLRTPKYWTKYTDTKKLKHWNLGGSSFEKVDQVTKSSISNALKKSVQVKTIVSIQRLENVGLFQKYGDECQRLFRKASMAGNFTPLDKVQNSLGPVRVMKYLDQSLTKHTYPEINEYFFFHGTKPNAVNLICEQGLDSRLGGGRLGVGVYGAEMASKSHGYTGTNSKGERPMFLVRMCLGDVFLTNVDTNFRRAPCKKCSNAQCTSHQEMYDSVVANGGAFSDREFVVYDRNQSYPEFLIWYIKVKMAGYRNRRLLDDSDSSLSESSESSESDEEEQYDIVLLYSSSMCNKCILSVESTDDSDELVGATYLPKHSSRGSSFQVKSGFQIGNITVDIVGGDITRQQVDVIVHSANPSLDLSQGRASSSLLSAAGRGIQRECRQNYPGTLSTGEIAVTTGGNLACKAIYHGVLAKYSSKKDEQILADLVTECLDQADADGYRSIAFPPIGTGYLSYPSPRVAEIMLECIKECTSRTITSVSIVIYSQESSTFQDFLNAAGKYSSSTSNQNHKQGSASKVSRHSGNSVRLGSVNIKVVLGALNKESADVLAHCAPKDLNLSTGALSRVLLNDAGPGLQTELNNVASKGINFGGLVITNGYNLSCKYVFHGTLPKWGTPSPDPSGCLEQFVTGCLETANFNSIRSIAFPTLGIGALGYPTKNAIKVMVQSIQKFSRNHPQSSLTDVSIVIFKGSQDSSLVQSELLNELGIGQSASGSTSQATSAASSTGMSRTKFSKNIGKISVNVIVGSLPDQNVSAVVNAIGQDLNMNSASSSALVSAAGPNLVQELHQKCPKNNIAFGFIAVTKGYNLKCSEVFHGALLSWYAKATGNTTQPDIILEEFVYNCLKTANSHGHKSIAFPALGTGQLKFPLDVAAACTVAAIRKFSAKYSISEVRIVLYGGSPDLKQLEKAYKDELSSPGKKVSAVGHPVPSGQSSQYHEPPRGTKAWLAWKYREDMRTPKYWTKYTNTKKLKDWNLDVRTNVHSLETVDQLTFNSIGATLKSTLGTVRIVSIKRIENVSLYQKYGDECQRLFRKASVEGNFVPLEKMKNSTGSVKVMKTLDPSLTRHTYPEINDYYFFHATKAQLVDVICSQGLDSRLANNGLLGSGVYGAEVAVKSHAYSGPNQKGERPMFLIRMCLGDVYMTGSVGQFRRPPCKICLSNICTTHQETYDSVVANFPQREFVVYDRNQSYPEYIIWYR